MCEDEGKEIRTAKERNAGMDSKGPCGVPHLSYSCCSSMILPVWAAETLKLSFTHKHSSFMSWTLSKHKHRKYVRCIVLQWTGSVLCTEIISKGKYSNKTKQHSLGGIIQANNYSKSVLRLEYNTSVHIFQSRYSMSQCPDKAVCTLYDL